MFLMAFLLLVKVLVMELKQQIHLFVIQKENVSIVNVFVKLDMEQVIVHQFVSIKQKIKLNAMDLVLVLLLILVFVMHFMLVLIVQFQFVLVKMLQIQLFVQVMEVVLLKTHVVVLQVI